MESNRRTFSFNTSFAFPASTLILIFIVLFAMNKSPHALEKANNRVGTILSTPQLINSFQLVRQDNNAFTNNDLKNHWTLLVFGTTHNNNVNTALSLLNQFYNTAEPISSPLQIVFVSTNPKKDTLKSINTYITSFNKNFIGVTGNPSQLKLLQKQLGIAAITYKNHHTNLIILVNPNAEIQAYIPANIKSEKIRLAFKEVVRQYTQQV